eukprot:3183080-Alexandrium_andersonii.AAC.1
MAPVPQRDSCRYTHSVERAGPSGGVAGMCSRCRVARLSFVTPMLAGSPFVALSVTTMSCHSAS